MAARRNSRQQAARQRRDRRGFAIAVVCVLCLLGGAGAYRAMLGPGPAPMQIGGPFTLADSDGHARSEASFRGRYMLIFFGYTSCTDICPQTLTEMSEALGKVDPDAARVQPIFITIDPQRDTPARLRRYTASFSSHLIGLTGSPSQLAAAERAFHVVVEPDRAPRATDIAHSAVLYLLGPNGDFVAPIPADGTRVTMQAALQRYVGGPETRRS